MSAPGRVALYGVIIFLSSAALLVLEITAGRLIAPYTGVSLYSWTSIIGVILAGLSLGNWLGGVWVERGAGERAAGATLLLAGIASLAVLLILTLVAPLVRDSGLSLLSASFLFVLSLFFVPAALLGVVTPLLTTLALRGGARPGHVVGMMHALAALGSIAGTFATGYWLIQHVGTRWIVILTAGLLFLLAAPLLWQRGRSLVAVAVMVTAGLAWATHARNGFANPCDEESAYYCIRVVDAGADVPFGRANALVLDHLLHGINHESEPGMLVSPYVQLTDELVLGYLGEHAERARYFFAGGGAYTHPRAVRALAPDADITVAEIDPAVTRAAGDELGVPVNSMRILHTDARIALLSLTDERFDAVVGDVFHDVAIPYHLLTREFNELVKARLAEDGVYLLNVVDTYPDPLLVKSVIKTLREDFRYVHAWLEAMEEEQGRATFVVSATDSAEPPPVLVAQRGFEREWQRVTSRLLRQGAGLDELPLLTDDYVPVERLVSRLLLTDTGR